MRKSMKGALLAIIFAMAALAVFLLFTQQGKGYTDKDAFIKELSRRGYVVQRIVQVTEDKDFGVNRNDIVTDDGTFHLYELESKEKAKAAASNVSPSGSSIKTPTYTWYINWGGHPHYYCTGKIIVVYVGRDFKVLYDMRSMMGKQAAGSKWYEVLLSKRGGS